MIARVVVGGLAMWLGVVLGASCKSPAMSPCRCGPASQLVLQRMVVKSVSPAGLPELVGATVDEEPDVITIRYTSNGQPANLVFKRTR